MSFNEDSHVKTPTLLHLVRLGYECRSLKELEWDRETNISLPIFYDSLKRLNPGVNQSQEKVFIKLLLNREIKNEK